MLNLFKLKLKPDILKKHSSILCAVVLFLLCYFVFFHNIGNYALIDVDETRYVSISRDMFLSKDFLTLYLNGEYFFEKPPLYFWGECLSFQLFNTVNEFSARFPSCIYAALCVMLMYFSGRKIVSERYGFISAVILASSLEFMIIAKLAILDIAAAACIGFSVMSGFLTQFVQEKYIKYCWWLFYMFSALGILAKGIPAFFVPFGTMFFVCLFNKSFKKIFKPNYIITGFIILLLIVLPWHITMFKMHNPQFFNEYILVHHIDRFFSSEKIHRAQPFYFYILTLLWGLCPYLPAAISVWITKLKKIEKISFSNMTNSRKFLWFNIIAFTVTFLFFSISSTKLITYILPAYFPASFIIAYIWEDYIFNNKYQKPVNISVFIFGSIFLFAAIAACFMHLFLPEKIYIYAKQVQLFGILLGACFGLCSIFFAIKNNKKGVFILYCLFVVILSAFGTKIVYNFDFSFGQNDLMKFAEYYKEHNINPIVINAPRKYSVLFYSEKPVKYIAANSKINSPEAKQIYLEKDNVIIVKNKEVPLIAYEYNYETIQNGIRYALLKIISKKG